MGFENQRDDSYNPDEEVGFETDDIDLDSGALPEARTVAVPKRSARERINVRHGMNRDRFGRRTYDENGDDDMGSGADMIAPDRPVRVSGSGGMSGVRTQRVVSEKSLFGDYLFTEEEPVDRHMSAERSGVLDALAYDEKRDGDGEQYESIFSSPPQSMVKRREGRRSSQAAVKTARKEQSAAPAEQEARPDSSDTGKSAKRGRFSQRAGRASAKEAEVTVLPARIPIAEPEPEQSPLRQEDYGYPRGEGYDYPDRPPYDRYPDRPPYDEEIYPPYGYGGYPPYPPYGGYPAAPYPPYGGYPVNYQNPYMQPQYMPYPVPMMVNGQPVYPAGTTPVMVPVMPGSFVYQPGQVPNADSVQQVTVPVPQTETVQPVPAEEAQPAPEEKSGPEAVVLPEVPAQREEKPEETAPAAEHKAEESSTGRFRRRGTENAANAQNTQPEPTVQTESEKAPPAPPAEGSGRFRRRGGASAAEPTDSAQKQEDVPAAPAPSAEGSGRFNRRRSTPAAAPADDSTVGAGAEESSAPIGPRRNAPLDAEALSAPEESSDSVEAPRASGRFNRRR